MSRPPEQRNTISPSRWIRLCQWLWDQRKFVWGTLILGILISIIANWLTSSTSIFTGTALGTILLWIRDHLLLAGFIGLSLFLFTLLVGVVSHLADTSTRADPTSGQQQSRRNLIHLLRNEYRRQIAESLQGAAMMPLALQQRTDVVLSSVSLVSWRMDTSGKGSLPAPTSIVQAYDDAGKRLLILGAPGAGKSTLLRELASELLTQPEEPIPVNVNLSSWAIKKSPLTAWMVDQLWETYNISPRLSQALIEQNQLLFLLDGLDEVELSARTKCIEAINAYLAKQEDIVPIVVCSRSHEYLEQEERLRVPVAIEVRPLTSEQVDGYLKSVGKPVAAVRAVLRMSPTLRQLITTPLMLSVVMLAYRGKTVKDLPQLGSAEDQQRQVFAHYVTRMLEQPTREWRYTADSTQKWLIWLAQQMKHHQSTEFYLERLQPSWLATQRTQKIHTWLFRLVVGLAFGLTTGLVFGLVVGLTLAWFYGLRSGLLVGLLSGLFFGLVGWLLGVLVGGLNENFWKKLLSALVVGTVFALLSGLAIGLVSALLVMLYEKDQEIRVADRLTLSWKHFWKKLPYGLALGLLIGLVTGLLSGPEVGLVTSLLGGLLLGLIIGLKGGLGSTQIAEDKRITPNQGIQNSGQNALRIGLMCMLGAGLLGGLTYGLLNGLATGLSDSLLDGLMAGLIFGQAYGGGSYLQHYVLRYQLWRRGAMPWHYVRFLEEAHERILLQRVGGGYRFIHPLFQEYFASLATTPALPSSPSQQP